MNNNMQKDALIKKVHLSVHAIMSGHRTISGQFSHLTDQLHMCSDNMSDPNSWQAKNAVESGAEAPPPNKCVVLTAMANK